MRKLPEPDYSALRAIDPRTGEHQVGAQVRAVVACRRDVHRVGPGVRRRPGRRLQRVRGQDRQAALGLPHRIADLGRGGQHLHARRPAVRADPVGLHGRGVRACPSAEDGDSCDVGAVRCGAITGWQVRVGRSRSGHSAACARAASNCASRRASVPPARGAATRRRCRRCRSVFETRGAADPRVAGRHRARATRGAWRFCRTARCSSPSAPGRLRIIRNGVLDPQPIAGVPPVHAAVLGGLLEVALHPRFAREPPCLPVLLEGPRGQAVHDRAGARRLRRHGARWT